MENLTLRRVVLVCASCVVFCSSIGYAATGRERLGQAAEFYRSGQFFKASRYAFAAFETDPSLKADSYAWVTLGLIRAGLPNAASYFFIRTLQAGNRTAIRSVLTQTQELLAVVGADLLRKFLIKYTRYEDYDPINRSAYLYALGKDAILSGDYPRAVGYLNGIFSSSPLWPFALQLRGSAYALQGRNSQALEDYRNCASRAGQIVGYQGNDPLRVQLSEREADDLRSRCISGEARTLYQMDKLEDADRVYDQIPKKSFVWPDVLFEQAWTAFGRQEYNRSLGKLASYKSPALGFLFNSEIDVLRAQSFLALCVYTDANQIIQEFDHTYTPSGEQVKSFVEKNPNNLAAFYSLGRSALEAPLSTSNSVYRLTNRFVRSPYFQNMLFNEREIAKEKTAIRRFDSTQMGVSHDLSEGYPGFLDQVLRWRVRMIQMLGGAFVKNSLLDYHASLIEDFDKMNFIKLEMLRVAKNKLTRKAGEGSEAADRSRGSVEPSRRDDQYRWSFNGEFWNDELGDYVFGLESECKS